MKTIYTLFLLLSVNLFYSQKVLIIGMDGVRSDALVQAKTPNLDLLMKNGLFSLSAWHLGKTKSGPGWSSMLSGVWDNKHAVFNNEFTNAQFDKYPFFPNRIKLHKPEFQTVLITGWKALSSKVFNAGWTKEYRKNSDEACKKQVLCELRENPDLVMVHFNDADKFGHLKGFELSNKKYIQAIESIDRKIGQILRELYDRPNFQNEDWLILVSTDHGGKGHGHGGESVEERKVWFIANNSKLPKMEIESIDPGSIFYGNTVDTSLAALCPQIVDIAATALHHLLGKEYLSIHKNWNLDGRSWFEITQNKAFLSQFTQMNNNSGIRYFNHDFEEVEPEISGIEPVFIQVNSMERCAIIKIDK